MIPRKLGVFQVKLNGKTTHALILSLIEEIRNEKK